MLASALSLGGALLNGNNSDWRCLEWKIISERLMNVTTALNITRLSVLLSGTCKTSSLKHLSVILSGTCKTCVKQLFI